MPHLEVNRDSIAINTDLPERFAGLPGYNECIISLTKAIYIVCSLSSINFYMIINRKKFTDGKARVGTVDLVLPDLSCNIRHFRDDENSNHDVHGSAQMKTTSNLFGEMLWQ